VDDSDFLVEISNAARLCTLGISLTAVGITRSPLLLHRIHDAVRRVSTKTVFNFDSLLLIESVTVC
jgi:hypothetical protein